MDCSEDPTAYKGDWMHLPPGQRITITRKAGEQHTGIVDEQTADGSIVWLFIELNERKLFHRDDGFRMTLDFIGPGTRTVHQDTCPG